MCYIGKISQWIICTSFFKLWTKVETKQFGNRKLIGKEKFNLYIWYNESVFIDVYNGSGVFMQIKID